MLRIPHLLFLAASVSLAIHPLASASPILPQEPPLASPFTAPPDVAAPPPDAVTTASGLAFKVLKPGTGAARPKPADRVTVHYTGWTTDGKMFDSSLARKKPSTFPLDRVLPGWKEGVQLMVVGEQRRFWVPEWLAFNKAAGRPAGMVVFDIELLDIEVALEAPVTPPDVAAPPADAEKRRSGLASRVIRPGTGTVHPKSSSTVTVHYSGWTRDGKMFESTVLQGQPASFRLDRVIEGWTEGLQLMVVGEIRRFWIPERLAYQGQSGAPRGMLVFDVELIAIK
jgi:peptidylprolyl isomerase